jgi:hypothetical protein
MLDSFQTFGGSRLGTTYDQEVMNWVSTEVDDRRESQDLFGDSRFRRASKRHELQAWAV